MYIKLLFFKQNAVLSLPSGLCSAYWKSLNPNGGKNFYTKASGLNAMEFCSLNYSMLSSRMIL